MISKNSLWSIAGSAFPAAAALLTIPILFTTLAMEQFAACSLLISLAIIFFVYDFGIGRSMTYFIAKTKYDSGTVNEIVGQGLFWGLIFSGVAAFLVFFTSPWFVQEWLKLTALPTEGVIQAFRVAAVAIPAGVLAHVYRGVLEGYSEFKKAAISKMISGISIFVGPLVVVMWQSTPDVVMLSFAITASRYISLVAYVSLAWSKIDIRRIRLNFRKQDLLIDYGFWAAISGLVSTMFIYGDRFFVAGYMGSEALSIYIASQDILIRFLLIPWAMAMVLLPVFAAGSLGRHEILQLYHRQQIKMKWLSFAFVIVALVVVWGFVDLLGLSAIDQRAKIMASMLIVGVFFAALSQLPLILLYGRGMPKQVAGVYGLEFLLYILVAPAVLGHFGEFGACAIWSGRLALEYGLLRYCAQKIWM